ncbi:MAG: UDP-3-O-(3-hydroxymyristoyl)glucosamine N-acyltransferase [Flavobacteriales bacterium]|nr:UDP-3-O-(3-hydroxymyristoyl)glucosamine N-acyltransferase [Flavobacteriales bacterium]
MDIRPGQTVRQLAEFLGCRYVGNPEHMVTGINEIHRVRTGDLVFVDHPKYYDKALHSAATTVLIDKEVDCPEGKALLISESPFNDFNRLTRHFNPFNPWESDRGEDVKIGEGTHLYPNVVLGNRVTIGRDCVIHAGVVIHDHTVIGDRVVIHANTVLGADAFYYQKKEGSYKKMHTCGRVIVHDDVEIGALCTVDKGVTADTIIGAGTKMDDHVHIGHDTVIGKNCLFAAQVGIAGCVTVEDDVVLWGQVGVVSDIVLGKGAVVLGQSGLMHDLEPGKTYLGSPAQEARDKWKEMALIRKLPDILEKLK